MLRGAIGQRHVAGKCESSDDERRERHLLGIPLGLRLVGSSSTAKCPATSSMSITDMATSPPTGADYQRYGISR